MSDYVVLTSAEEKLAELIWDYAPIGSMELVAIALEKLDWKKSTTFTVLRKLCHKSVFKNENAVVSVLLTRDELLARSSRQYVEEAFGGSLPRFITSFFGGKQLSEEQISELKSLIAEHEAGGKHE
jgi:predicted transcriptional regulator